MLQCDYDTTCFALRKLLSVIVRQYRTGGIVERKTEEQNNNIKYSFMSHIVSREWDVEESRKYTLLSDVFMGVALNDIPACQHVLRIITGIANLKVKEIRTQYRISKVTSHDAILDVLAEDEDGKLYNIEIQRANTKNHAKRTRFYGAMVDSEFLQKGKSYNQMPEVYIIYVSETDIWKSGLTICEASRRLGSTNIPYEDGMHIIYVNAAVDDGSEIAKLMKYFKTADPEDMSQGELSKRVHFLKCEEGGHEIMCEVSDRILRNRVCSIAINLAKKGFSIEMIAEVVEVNAELVRKWLKESQMV